MLGGETVLINGCEVRFGAVTNVLVEAVFWVFGGEIHHVIVTGDFGNDGGGGDGFNLGVTFNASRSIFF